MNSEMMTDDVRAEYKDVPPFWFPSWAMFAGVCTGLVAFCGFCWLAAFWLPPQLAKYSGLSLERAYIAAAVIAILSYLIWFATNLRHCNRVSLSIIWGAIVIVIGISFLFTLGYETKAGADMITGWITSKVGLGMAFGYFAIKFIIVLRAAYNTPPRENEIVS